MLKSRIEIVNCVLYSLYLIYLGLTLHSTHCMVYIMTDSFKDKENQYIVLGQDSALQTDRHR